MKKLWRCLNEGCVGAEGVAGFDFEADQPVCPKCGTDGRKHSQMLCERAKIHYLVSDKNGPIVTPHGSRLVACDPAAKRLPKYATGHHAAVTCPECLATDVLKAHAAGEVVQHQRIIRGGGVPDSTAVL